jgi:plastocyanin
MRKVLILVALTVFALGLAVGHASGGDKTVRADDFDFEPGRVTIQEGDKVTWRNVEGRHTVTLRNGTYDKVIDGNDKVSRKFRNSGTYRYYCRFHTAEGMRGKVIVE